MINLKENERLDDLNLKGYQIIQNVDNFCFGIDAVLLSEFATVKKDQNVLDLGTGSGIIPILLEAKTNASHITGLEIQESSVDTARRSVAFNKLEDKIDIIQGDIKEAGTIFGRASIDVVTSNPPYMIDMHGIQNPDMPKAIARHELLCSLEDVVSAASFVLKDKGKFFMVHRPHRMIEIVHMMRKYDLEPKRVRMVHSFVHKEAAMLLIEGIKGGKSYLRVDKPLIIYKEVGIYTEEVASIYE